MVVRILCFREPGCGILQVGAVAASHSSHALVSSLQAARLLSPALVGKWVNVTPSLYSDYWMQNLNIIEHQIFHGRFLFFFHAEGFVFFCFGSINDIIIEEVI